MSNAFLLNFYMGLIGVLENREVKKKCCSERLEIYFVFFDLRKGMFAVMGDINAIFFWRLRRKKNSKSSGNVQNDNLFFVSFLQMILL
jgi:hypothetical protein